MRYRDRNDAGRQLARHLLRFADRGDVIVLALPRGGVPVGFEVAKALRPPLDIFLARNLGVPGLEEYAMGAIASGGVRVLKDEVIEARWYDDFSQTGEAQVRVLLTAAEEGGRHASRVSS